jgi:hypothetical protein
VEVDEQQVNLTRFNLFFPEKRPFFLENAGVFAFGTPESVDLFFSRRIGIDSAGRAVPITGGGRLSGRAGSLTLGVLDIQTGAIDSAGQGRISPPNNFSVARVIRELPHRSRIGAIAVARTNTDSTGDYNITAGIDGKVGIGETVSIDGYFAHSETPNRSGAANSYNLSGSYTTRKWEVGAALRHVDDAFNPDVGFLERPSFVFYSLRILRHLRTPQIPWFRETRPHLTFRQFDDVDGRPQSRLIHIDSHFLFANGAFFEAPGLNFTREALRAPFEIAPGVVIPAGLYDHFEWASNYNSNLSAPYSFAGNLTIGGFYTGHRVSSTLSLTARPNARFNATLRVGRDDVHLEQGHFINDLIGLRLGYTFTPRMYLQALTQYNTQTASILANVRFGWLGPAGTGLFIVYNEGRTTGIGAAVAGRTFAVKFARQFDLGN